MKHDEGERLRQAIRALDAAPAVSEGANPPASEGSGIVRQVVANTHAKGRPPELVFLLNNGGYFVFQLEPRVLAELRSALDQIEAS